MKVLYFIEEAKLGGPQVQMVRVAAALADRADVEILMPEENSGPLRRLCDEHGVRWRTFPISRLTREPGPLATFLVRSPFEVFRLARHVRRARPDLIHAWGGSWQVKAALLARVTRVPLVWLINDTSVPPLILAAFRRFARLGSGFIFASERSAGYYLPHVPRAARKTVVQSMVDLDAFDPSRFYRGDEELLAELGDAPVVGMVANISPVKGIETFVRVAARAQACGSRARFVVIGSAFARQAAYLASLRTLCGEVGASNVIFAGPRHDVRPLLRRLNVYLCTSLSESSPVAVWEAMAMGCPVVSTAVGDVPRFVRPGESGAIAAVGDDAGLWAAVRELIDDLPRARRMGAAARDIARDTFDRKTIAAQTLAFYRSVRGMVGEASARASAMAPDWPAAERNPE